MEAIQQHAAAPASGAMLFRRTREAVRLMVLTLAKAEMVVNVEGGESCGSLGPS